MIEIPTQEEENPETAEIEVTICQDEENVERAEAIDTETAEEHPTEEVEETKEATAETKEETAEVKTEAIEEKKQEEEKPKREKRTEPIETTKRILILGFPENAELDDIQGLFELVGKPERLEFQPVQRPEQKFKKKAYATFETPQIARDALKIDPKVTIKDEECELEITLAPISLDNRRRGGKKRDMKINNRDRGGKRRKRKHGGHPGRGGFPMHPYAAWGPPPIPVGYHYGPTPYMYMPYMAHGPEPRRWRGGRGRNRGGRGRSWY